MDFYEIVPQGPFKKRKVWIEFGVYGLNCLGFRGQIKLRMEMRNISKSQHLDQRAENSLLIHGPCINC